MCFLPAKQCYNCQGVGHVQADIKKAHKRTRGKYIKKKKKKLTCFTTRLSTHNSSPIPPDHEQHKKKMNEEVFPEENLQ
jgi:hypothetical protein